MNDKRILIIEDDNDNQVLLEEIISSCSSEYSYSSVNNGEDAINASKSDKFDLAFVDMSVPGKNGFDIIKALRKTQNNIPVIALTANAMKGTKEKILKSGFNEYISKPCTIKDLKDIIKKYLEEKQKILIS